MKKFSIVVVVMLLCATAFASASSISVPWFNDNLDPSKGAFPATASGIAGFVVLKSNSTDVLTCTLKYYNSSGEALGPFGPTDNTFSIAPLSSISFRPCVTDTNQESAVARLVPNRPRSVDASTPIPGTHIGNNPLNGGVIDQKYNGAISISWEGPNYLIQGIVTYFQTTFTTTGAPVAYSYGTLLPPGF